MSATARGRTPSRPGTAQSGEGDATVRLSAPSIGEGPGVVLVWDGMFENDAVDPLNAGDWIQLDGTASVLREFEATVCHW